MTVVTDLEQLHRFAKWLDCELLVDHVRNKIYSIYFSKWVWIFLIDRTASTILMQMQKP